MKMHKQFAFDQKCPSLTSTVLPANRLNVQLIGRVLIALGTFSALLEHYFTSPALLSTFLAFEQNFSIFSLYGQHLSNFLQFFTCLMQYFVFETFLVSQVINLNNSTLSPDR